MNGIYIVQYGNNYNPHNSSGSIDESSIATSTEKGDSPEAVKVISSSVDSPTQLISPTFVNTAGGTKSRRSLNGESRESASHVTYMRVRVS